MQRGGDDFAKWVAHYCSDHQILLVGEGDFSFSYSLARSFGSAANIVASSLDSYDDVTKKYKHAKSNLDGLQKLGACLLHEVDAAKMKFHSDLKMLQFDRIIFNFPHAGFHKREDDTIMIKMHMNLVFGFFKNASCLLRAYGEIHVNHKTTAPFSHWNIEKLAIPSFLTLIELADFRKEDYPGYNNKRGDSYRCDEPFPLGKCSTFKFIYDPRVLENGRGSYMASRQQRYLPFHEIQEPVDQSPTLVDLNYYPQTCHFTRMNEQVTSRFGLTNGYTPISGGYFNNGAVEHGRVAPYASYSAHGMSLGSQRSLQPKQSLQFLKPWPTPSNVRFSKTDHVRTVDNAPLSLGSRNESLGQTSENAGYSFDRVRPHFERRIAEIPRRNLSGARNEGYGVFGGSSNYLQGAPGRTAENAGYFCDSLRPDFERCIPEDPRRNLSDARNEGYHEFGGSSNYLQEAFGRRAENAGYSFDRLRPDFERCIAEAPWRNLSGDRNEGYHVLGGGSNYLQGVLDRSAENASYSFDRPRPDFERCIAEVPRRTLSDDRNEGYHACGDSSKYLQGALGRTVENAGYSFDRLRPEFAEVPRRTFSGARNEVYNVFGGSSNYFQGAFGTTIF